MKYLLIGLITLILYAIFFAPASLIKKGLESSSELSMTDIRGSLWNGSALLSMPGKTQKFDLGLLAWKFVPQALFSLCITYRVELHSETHEFTGLICRSKDTIEIEGDLNLHANLLNKFLINYDMQVSGLLEMRSFRLKSGLFPIAVNQLPVIEDLSARMHWPGGGIQYRLGGLDHTLKLPAMVGDLGLEDGRASMRVFEHTMNDVNAEQNIQIPLILGSLDQSGWISIGITKKFTKLLNQPWPGSEPDHAVVLEVQEKLL